LIQEIILQLWKSFGRYDEQYKLSTWIYKIALNVAISFYRNETRKKTTISTLPQDELVYLNTDEYSTLTENSKHLMAFISELKELDRALILLYLEDRNYNDIAEIVGLSTTNVSTKLYRIKNILASKFAKLKSQNHE
jgi:RNA polymerase sigma-70 factor (ECF subfamily)